jgi:hypothetical protein
MLRPLFPSTFPVPYTLFHRIAVKLPDIATRTIMTSPHRHITHRRVPVKRSDKYKFNGRASYLHAIRKWGFETYFLQNYHD